MFNNFENFVKENIFLGEEIKLRFKKMMDT